MEKSIAYESVYAKYFHLLTNSDPITTPRRGHYYPYHLTEEDTGPEKSVTHPGWHSWYPVQLGKVQTRAARVRLCPYPPC